MENKTGAICVWLTPGCHMEIIITDNAIEYLSHLSYEEIIDLELSIEDAIYNEWSVNGNA